MNAVVENTPQFILNVPATLASFTHEKYGRHKVSYSRWKAQQRCTFNWFADNFAVWDGAGERTYVQNSLHSIHGSLVQRAWEAFINERMYKKLPYSKEAWTAWFEQSMRGLYQLLVLPLAAQFDFPGGRTGTYFRTKTGQARLEAAYAAGLPIQFRGNLKHHFVDKQELESVYGTQDEIIGELVEGTIKTLTKLAELGANFDTWLSEQYIESRLAEPTIGNGGVDFLANPPGTPGVLTSLAQLREDYTLLDGKIRFGRTLDSEQLFFYAAIIQFRYRVRADKVGFINWTTGQPQWYQYMPAYASKLRAKVAGVYRDMTPLENTLRNSPHATMPLFELPYLKKMVNDKQCGFCPLLASCKEGLDAGYKPRESSVKLATPKLALPGFAADLLATSSDDPTTTTQEVTL